MTRKITNKSKLTHYPVFSRLGNSLDLHTLAAFQKLPVAGFAKMLAVFDNHEA